jgi:UDP-glucose 4-epimerase
MKIFIIGGAGYIGSHMVKAVHKAGHEVITIDNLSTGHEDSVLYGKFEFCDILDTDSLKDLFLKYSPDAVMHFAAFSLVGESISDPYKYYYNNVSGTLSLLNVMNETNCKKLVFSSSAAIFGNPIYSPIDEDHPKEPINPYGKSKLMIENIFKDFDSAYGLKYISLRYFNAAGHDNEGKLSERHNPETHLIPIIMQVARGEKKFITIFGSDYDTKDGTCVRDYIFIEDLVKVHLESLYLLFDKGFNSSEFNLGSGIGYSVREVIQEISKITGENIKFIDGERRVGDPPVLISSNDKINKEINVKIDYYPLDKIIKTLK